MYQTRIYRTEQKLEESDFGRYLYDLSEIQTCKDSERREFLKRRIERYEQRIRDTTIVFNGIKSLSEKLINNF